MIFLSAEGGRVTGLHKEKRSPEWSFMAGDTCSAPPVLEQTERVVTPSAEDTAAEGGPAATGQEADFLYIASEDGFVYRLNVFLGWKWPGARGGESWKGETKARIVTSPVAYQQRVFVASLDYSLYAFEDVDGARAWKYHVGRYVREQPFAFKNLIFVLAQEPRSDRRTLYAINARDGKCRWKRTETGTTGDNYQEDGLPGVETFVAPGLEVAYVLAQRADELWGVRYEDGKILHRIPLTQRPDFVVCHDADHGRDETSRGLIFLADKNGRVLALKERRVY
jgi:outer membrane protein assembly factor BamB